MNMQPRSRHRLPSALVCATAVALIAAGAASAHARISPPVSLSNELQLYSLAVPTEKANAYTTKIVLTVPQGFSIDSFVPSPGWTPRAAADGLGRQRGDPEGDLDRRHVCRPGKTRSSSSSAQPAKSGTYTFQVQQTYSDSSIVNWADPESGANPAPTIEAKSLTRRRRHIAAHDRRPRGRGGRRSSSRSSPSSPGQGRRREETARMRTRGRLVLGLGRAGRGAGDPGGRLGARVPR